MVWNEYYQKDKCSPTTSFAFKSVGFFSRESLSKTALDIGCGSGIDTIYLLNNGWQVTAIEKEAGGIQQLRSAVSPPASCEFKYYSFNFRKTDRIAKVEFSLCQCEPSLLRTSSVFSFFGRKSTKPHRLISPLSFLVLKMSG